MESVQGLGKVVTGFSSCHGDQNNFLFLLEEEQKTADPGPRGGWAAVKLPGGAYPAV